MFASGDKYVGDFKNYITEKAPLPTPMATNTLVNTRMAKPTDKHLPMPMGRRRRHFQRWRLKWVYCPL